jgi:hypothetical protein
LKALRAQYKNRINTIEIKFPIWNNGERVVGLANFRLQMDNRVIIAYTRKSDGQRSFPDDYYISGADASKYPTKQLKGGVKVHLVPIRDLEVIKYYDSV